MAKNLNLIACLGITLLLASCGNDAAASNSSLVEQSSSDEASMISSAQEESSLEVSSEAESSVPQLDPDAPSLRDLYHKDGRDAVSSIGDQDLLVLPIELQGYPFTSHAMDDLDRCLNGNGPEDTQYWESLSSYYYKSSYGKLNLSYEIANPYVAVDETGDPLSPREVYSTYGPGSSSGDDYGLTLIQHAYEQYLEEKGEEALRRFDKDGDGYLDGVIAVYSCPDYASGMYRFDQTGYYWAFTTWASQLGTSSDIYVNQPNPIRPGIDVYFWVSINFMYESTYARTHSGALDPHTFIHESGHMLGLDDYYPMGTTFSPLGGLDMMDLNIMDHNCYSKFALGWVDPILVSGEADITLRPFEESGDCILIPTSSFNGTAFDEYLMIEFYTPTGLNELDAFNRLDYSRPYGYQEPGIRIYHVDSRVAKYHVDKGALFSEYVKNDEVWDDQKSLYRIAASNCHKSGLADESYSLIHMIEAGGKNTFAGGALASDESLFHQGDNFLIYQYSSFFPNKRTFNNGEEFPYVIYIDELSEHEAKIGIEKLA